MSTQKYDFVAIGDITIDAFIQLSKDDAMVTKDEKTGRKYLDKKELMDFLKPGLHEVAAGSFGVCLIAREVFTKIPFMYEPKMSGHSDIFWFNECFRQQYNVYQDTGAYCEHEYSDWGQVKDK